MRPALPEATVPAEALAAAFSAPAQGWAAELNLHYAWQAHPGPPGRTVLARRSHHGPLYVQRPFYPEGQARCHSVLLHPPGGIVAGRAQGDRLAIQVEVGPQAQALLTTPAAGKFYRSAGGAAELRQTLRVRDLGLLEWLPQETICFAGCRAQTSTRVELAPSARFIGWEVLCLGRPASGEAFATGELVQRLEVLRDGRPLLLERTALHGGSALLHGAWGLHGRTVLGTLLALHPSRELTAAVREALPVPAQDDLVGVTTLNGVLVARILSRHAEHARAWLQGVWQLLRPLVADAPAVPPRIWAT